MPNGNTDFAKLLYDEQKKTNKEIFGKLDGITNDVSELKVDVAVLKTKSETMDRSIASAINSMNSRPPRANFRGIPWVAIGQGIGAIIIGIGAAIAAIHGF